jgi:hypothetical protein
MSRHSSVNELIIVRLCSLLRGGGEAHTYKFSYGDEGAGR